MSDGITDMMNEQQQFIEKQQFYEDLVAKVKQMRTAQKNYFATRRKKFLIQSKELETEVDLMIKNL